MSAKVKSTSTFKQLLKGLTSELEQQQAAFEEQIGLYRKKESEFEDLKVRVSQLLQGLATKDKEIVSLKATIKKKTTEISEREIKIKCKFR